MGSSMRTNPLFGIRGRERTGGDCDRPFDICGLRIIRPRAYWLLLSRFQQIEKLRGILFAKAGPSCSGEIPRSSLFGGSFLDHLVKKALVQRLA